MSTKHTRIGLGVALIAAVLFAGSAQATYIWENELTPISIQDLIDEHDGEFQVGDKLFDYFTVSGTSQGGALLPNASAVNIVGTSNNGEFGLVFTTAWSVAPGQFMDSFLQFRITALDPLKLIHDNTLAIAGQGGFIQGGSISVAESVFVNPRIDPDGDGPLEGDLFQGALANKFVYWRSNTDNILVDHQIFLDPVSGDEVAYRSVWVTKDILLTGGESGGSGVLALSAVIQTFSQIPEPASLALFGLGAATVLWRRRTHV